MKLFKANLGARSLNCPMALALAIYQPSTEPIANNLVKRPACQLSANGIWCALPTPRKPQFRKVFMIL
jgi:hypothetical protein